MNRSNKKSKVLNIATVVWGQTFVNSYTAIVLPHILKTRDLQLLHADPRVDLRYHIFTTKDDICNLQNSEALKDLGAIISPSYHLMPKGKRGKYQNMTMGHKCALWMTQKENGAVIFLAPDCIFSEGSLIFVAEQWLKSGYTIILTSAPRLNLFEFERIQMKTTKNTETSSEFLVDFALKSLHSITKKQIYNSENSQILPNNLIWRTQNRSLIIRSFHPLPVLVQPSNASLRFESTIDDDLINYFENERIFYCKNSSQCLFLELTKPSETIKTRAKNIKSLVGFAINNASSKHIASLREPFIISRESDRFSGEISQQIVDSSKVVQVIGKKYRENKSRKIRRFQNFIFQELMRCYLLFVYYVSPVIDYGWSGTRGVWCQTISDKCIGGKRAGTARLCLYFSEKERTIFDEVAFNILSVDQWILRAGRVRADLLVLDFAFGLEWFVAQVKNGVISFSEVERIIIKGVTQIDCANRVDDLRDLSDDKALIINVEQDVGLSQFHKVYVKRLQSAVECIPGSTVIKLIAVPLLLFICGVFRAAVLPAIARCKGQVILDIYVRHNEKS
ncbi:hypothetical protein OAQ35_04005 [Litorivicinus sp.]|nr:hypothetical protein [Litorivicinus sp.]